MLRRTAVTGGTLLALVHAWTLRTQILDGSVAEPAVLARWLVGALLACGLVAVWRAGAGRHVRHIVALCLLVATLHGPAVVDRMQAPQDQALPSATLMLEIAASAALSLTALSTASRQTWVYPASTVGLRSRRSAPAKPVAGRAFAITARPPPRA